MSGALNVRAHAGLPAQPGSRAATVAGLAPTRQAQPDRDRRRQPADSRREKAAMSVARDAGG